ncbi:DUF1627 domain-containing protein, partial [Escherichia coli O111:H5]
YCMPGGNLPAEPKAASVTETDGKAFPQPAGVALPAQEAATQEDIKTETVADIVQPLEKRVCAALRELNKYRDIVTQLCQEAEQ